jgi:hypothetical protein
MWGSVEGFLKCRKISTLVETHVEKLDKAGSTVLHRIDELAPHQSDAPEHKPDPPLAFLLLKPVGTQQSDRTTMARL